MSDTEHVMLTVRYLVDNLGYPVVSLLSEADEATVAAWMAGMAKPGHEAVERLSLATEIVKSLESKGKGKQHRARKFFCGGKHALKDGVTPGYAIRQLRGDEVRQLRDEFVVARTS